MNDTLKLKLQAWVDGEVSPSQARRLAHLVERDADARQLVSELRMTCQLLAANEPQVAVPETPEFYWGKIARQIQSQASQPAPMRSRVLFGWRRFAAAAAAFAAVTASVLLMVRHFAPMATFDEVSATGDGMEAMTFHDQSAGMTVVWLQDAQDGQSPQPTDAPLDDGDSDIEM